MVKTSAFANLDARVRDLSSGGVIEYAPLQAVVLAEGRHFLCPNFTKRTPRAHQFNCLEKCRGKTAFAFLHAMRTGKTKCLVDDWSRLVLEEKVDDLLVVGPNGALPPWVEAMRQDLPDQVLGRMVSYTWASGKANQRAPRLARQALLQAPLGIPRVLLVNIEAISSVAAARDLCRTFLEQRPGRSMIAIDESVCIKNPTSICSKFVVNVLSQRSQYRRILSGLVAPRSPLDLYQQFNFLDPRILGFSSFFAFKRRYAVLKKIPVFHRGRAVEIVVGYRDVADLNRRIDPYSDRVTLDDVYDLPESDYSFRDVELTAEQRRVYGEIKEFATTKLESGDHVTAQQVIVQMLRLHQVLCGHVRDEHGGWHGIAENRTETLLSILRDYDGKAVIWVSYDVDVEKISKAISSEFGAGSLARFWGGNASTREKEEFEFRTRDDCRFMVATPDAGGKGRDWSVADLVIYYSSRNNLDHRLQSEERVKSSDKTRPIAYIDLRAPGTVDEKIIGALRKKIDIAGIIQGDDFREWLI